jgi:Zn ribbon nucleic-acid-binding protein
VRLGDQQCPRCRESFTISYWSDGTLIQARCLSCELKWPLPNVV